ncbi:beta-glucosidase 12 [Prunus yedoensis var. nudiflora]|uniref:Beta-glucosidase 12 n=1 Tax=Prunus yedoensis var. nudiflora TaxID=2094558 RepID=A0A314Z308_PRUYE|nr:beta-glucosidase 12 [Prunus yedoensis var. nudiflora]
MAMQLRSFLLGILLLIGFAFTNSEADIRAPPTHFDTASLNRSSFPEGFIFGVGSGSYQYEGAAKEGGRGPSIWDTFTHKYPEKINDSSNGDITVDQYHRYKEDVGIMKNMGWDAYRFSISWSRLLPNGKLSGGVNKEGIKYYNNLINELLRNGLTPFVTLFHWDLPQTLEDEYGGFLSPHIVFAEPLTSGDYPQSMRSLVGSRLPKFTKEQSKLLIGSFDFLGLNYYTGYYASDAPQNNSVYASYTTDYELIFHILIFICVVAAERNGVPIGPKGASEWLNVYPQEFKIFYSTQEKVWMS